MQMARTVRDANLDNRSARQRLEPRKKPYYRLITTGNHIGYYRGERGGSWLARTYTGGRYVESTLGTADDIRDANGSDVLSFSQAQAKARDWFDQLAMGPIAPKAAPYTVAQACDAYAVDYAHRSGKDDANLKGRIDRIKAALGAKELSKLKANDVRDWLGSVATAPKLTRCTEADENTGLRPTKAFDAKNPDAVRKRRATANRHLTVLKAALNHAFHQPPEGVTVDSRTAWESVKPFRGADAPKVRNISDVEARRLLDACPVDFRALVVAALMTGCRYGELCRLRVQDFDKEANALRIEMSKSGKSRSIALTDEGTRHFVSLAEGKSGDALLLARANGSPWSASHQLRRMADACAKAKIAPAISFHILRHTYGSRLAMAGAPMGVIAAQLGHADTRMTERHYAHLGPSYVATTVRSLFVDMGVAMATDPE
jgi:integrase